MTVYPLTFRADMMAALRAGAKTETRRLVKAGNSRVLPGTFEGVDLGTARIRTSRHGTLTEIRARCELPSGPRVVTLGPKVQPGDIFWTRKPRGRRKDSRLTLTVAEVHARRLQDMSDADALAEGIEHYAGKGSSPRLRFAALWDEINGEGGWQENPWVWVYRFETVTRNVDRVLAAIEAHARPRAKAGRRAA